MQGNSSASGSNNGAFLPGGRAIKVLHITESFAGGVKAAIVAYAKAVPEAEHLLLATTGRSEAAFSVPEGVFSKVAEMPRGLRAARRAIRARVHVWEPDIVHAHSSYAGAYLRLAVQNSRHVRIVYTPHGFGFERLDLSPLSRAAIWTAEELLSGNTDTIAGCSPREARLASRMLAKRSQYVPNIAGEGVLEKLYSRDRRPARSSSSGITIACLGRIAAQRDPHFVIDAWLRLRKVQRGCRMLWIGDGDPALKEDLLQSGVHVTGWIERNMLADQLGDVDILIHPGRWDGFAVAILEASVLQIPLVARKCAALEDAPTSLTAADAESLASEVEKLIASESAQMANLEAWRHYLRYNTPRNQRSALLKVYGMRQTEI